MNENYERSIGRLEGKLDQLIEQQSQMTRKWEGMAREFAKLLRRQDAQTRELVRLKQQLDAAAEPAHEFIRWRERAVGALMLLSLCGAVVGGSAVAFWQKFSTFLR